MYYELVIIWWVRMSYYSKISFLVPIVFELSERTHISDISSKRNIIVGERTSLR
jgi:hypothetical protein